MVRATTWTWPGWIAEGHITVLAGESGVGKSWFALDALQGLARRAAAPLVLIHHLRKRQMTDSMDAFDLDRLRGSSVLAHTAACLIGIDQPDRYSPVWQVHLPPEKPPPHTDADAPPTPRGAGFQPAAVSQGSHS